MGTVSANYTSEKCVIVINVTCWHSQSRVGKVLLEYIVHDAKDIDLFSTLKMLGSSDSSI